MRKLFNRFLFLIIATLCLTPAAFAQNLYVNNLGVYYPYGKSDNNAYCNFPRLNASGKASMDGSAADVNTANTVNVSSVISPGDDIWKYSAKIEFDQPVDQYGTSPKLKTIEGTGLPADISTDKANYKFFYPNSCLMLCASIQCTSSTAPISFGVDELVFEIFKFADGSNPLDSSTSPALKTISVFNLGAGKRCRFCDGSGSSDDNACTKGEAAGDETWHYTSQGPLNFGTFCAAWDGSYNLAGDFGKTNGFYGFRAIVKTNQQSSQGTQVDVMQTAAYPGQNQIPVRVDVVDVHNVISSVTAVGKAVVAAAPYNFKYQLSKDATVSIRIFDADAEHNCDWDNIGSAVDITSPNSCLVRTLISSAPRTGEGNSNAPIANSDYWDGLNDEGAMVPAGSYLVSFSASANDEFGADTALGVTRQMTLDPLQITDLSIKPLGAGPTEQAHIGYVLTEDATVIVRIYKPGTNFDSIHLDGFVDGVGITTTTIVHEQLDKAPGDGAGVYSNEDKLIRTFIETKDRRKSSITYWDGRDEQGNLLCDGDYVYAMFAVKPSNGEFNNGQKWTGITTSRIRTGTVPILRGPILSSFERAHSVLGSSPAVYGLSPFSFEYMPTRDTTASLEIFKMDGTTSVRKLITNVARPGGFKNKEVWDGLDDQGHFVSSGTYMAQLTLEDPYTCMENRISSKSLSIPVNLLRVTDVVTSPLLSAASAIATIGYTLSETMDVTLNIYEPGTVIVPENWPNAEVAPASKIVYSITGVRPRRMHFTEPWDGKNNNGNMLADGVYPFVITAHTDQDGTRKYASDLTYGFVTVARGKLIFNKFKVSPTIATVYNSSDAVRLPPYSIEYSLSRQSSVTINVVDWQDPTKVFAEVTIAESRDADTSYTDYWDGKCTKTVTSSPSGLTCSAGDFVQDGYYKFYAIAEDADQEEALRQPATNYFVTDIAPLQIYDVSIKEVAPDSPGIISYQVSEPMKVVTKIYEPGTVVPGGGMYTEPSSSIVKRIIGTKSSRVAVEDIWDGTDLTMFPVDDGTYVFTIFGTTVTTAVDGIYGTLSTNTAVRTDYDSYSGNILTYTIPVTRSGNTNVCESFEKHSYFAPNPYSGSDGWFRIPVKATGYVSMKIYNVAGDMVYSKNYGRRGSDESINGKGKCSETNHTHEACWPGVNNSGKKLARGVYYAVLRFEAADGSKAICQTVKKILIP